MANLKFVFPRTRGEGKSNGQLAKKKNDFLTLGRVWCVLWFFGLVFFFSNVSRIQAVGFANDLLFDRL